MKTKLCVGIVLVAAAILRAQTNDLTALLQQGLFEEQASRNLDAAIASYQTLAAQFDKDRALAATAVFRLGECYRAQGRTNEAAAQYQRILRDFSDQQTLATLSRQNIVGLRQSPSIGDLPTTGGLFDAASEASKLSAELNGIKRLNDDPEEQARAVFALFPDDILKQMLLQLRKLEEQKNVLQSNQQTNRDAQYRAIWRKLGSSPTGSSFHTAYGPDGIAKEAHSTNLLDDAQIELQQQYSWIKERVDFILGNQEARLKVFQTAIQQPRSGTLTPNQTAARQQQRELLAKQIALAEQDLAETQKMVQAGVAGPAEARAAEREVLRLKQQLAALDSGKAELLDLSVPAKSEEDQEIERIQKVIQDSPDLINATDEHGHTPLENAAIAGWPKVASFLLDHGANVNGGRYMALEMAVNSGHLAVVELLLSRGADINAKTRQGQIPLITAAEHGYQAIVEALLAHHADVNEQDNLGDTPLFSAAVSDARIPIVKALLAGGAEINHSNPNGYSILVPAAENGAPEMMQVLLKAGGDPNIVDGSGRTPLSYAVEKESPQANRPFRPNFAGGRSTTPGGGGRGGFRSGDFGAGPSNLPAEKGTSEVVKLLLAAKADPNLGKVDSPLLCAVFRGNTEAAELLLAAGANPNAVGELNLSSQRQNTAEFMNHNSHLTPLWLATFLNEPSVVQMLLKYKADPNDSLTDERALIFNALDKPEILTALLDAGAKVDAVGFSPNAKVGNDEFRWTPLGMAAFMNSGVAVESLLKHSANPNFRDPIGHYTPLHWAADRVADRQVFELLLAYKADRNVRDINGQTPLDILKEKAKPDNLTTDSAGKAKAGELADMLRQHGALDNLPDWDRITVSRPAASFSATVFQRGTNDWNHFTLLEFIYVAGFYGNRQSALGFPDLAHIVIARPAADGVTARRMVVNLLKATNELDCTRDMPLEFGDMVEIPEREHSLAEPPVFLSTEQQQTLMDYFHKQAGEAKLAVAGGRTVQLPLPPIFALIRNVLSDGAARAALTSSSDLSRVKVTRRDPKTGKTEDWILDCSSHNQGTTASASGTFQQRLNSLVNAAASSPPDLWLRDGDVIEVSAKP